MNEISKNMLIGKIKVDLLNFLSEDTPLKQQLKADVLQFLLYDHAQLKRMLQQFRVSLPIEGTKDVAGVKASFEKHFNDLFQSSYQTELATFENEQGVSLASYVSHVLTFYVLGITALSVTNDVDVSGSQERITETRTCVQVLSTACSDANLITQADCTATAYAFLQEQLDILKAKGAIPMVSLEDTPGNVIWVKRNIEKMLIRANTLDETARIALVNGRDALNTTPLYVAVILLRDKELSQGLIKAGADINACGGNNFPFERYDFSILHKSIMDSDLETYYLARELGASVFVDAPHAISGHPDYNNLLFWFVTMGSPGDVKGGIILEDLLSSGAGDINRTYLDSKDSLLHLAAKRGLSHICAVLLKAGANPLALNKGALHGHTPFQIAVEQDHPDVCEVLLSELHDIEAHLRHGGASILSVSMLDFLIQAGWSFKGFDYERVNQEIANEMTRIKREIDSLPPAPSFAALGLTKVLTLLKKYPLAIAMTLKNGIPMSHALFASWECPELNQILQFLLTNAYNSLLKNTKLYYEILYNHGASIFYSIVLETISPDMKATEDNAEALVETVKSTVLPSLLADYIFLELGKECFKNRQFAYAAAFLQEVRPGSAHYRLANELGFTILNMTLGDKSLSAAEKENYHQLQFTFALNALNAGSSKISQGLVNALFNELCGNKGLGTTRLASDVRGNSETLIDLAATEKSKSQDATNPNRLFTTAAALASETGPAITISSQLAGA